MRTFLLLGVLTLAACGPPVLRNAPRPNGAAVAGAAAAIAGAVTLADPAGAAKVAAEANKPTHDKKPQKSGGTVPADVFDRLDEQQSKPPGASDPEPAAPAPEP